MAKSPIIGITGYHIRGEEGYGGLFRGVPGQGFSVFGHDYIHSVQKVGGIPLTIPVGEQSTSEAIIERLDGVILSGGEDIDPTLYGSHPDQRCWMMAPERDRYELEVLATSLRLNKPVLAICRGMQLVNIHFGGTLYIDIEDYSEKVLAHQFGKAPRWYLAHRVKLISEMLKNLYMAEEIQTNSYHHQSVKDVGVGLQIAALAEDGIVEGLFHPEHPNLLAIQWHPEMMSVQNEAGLIPFRWLMDQIEKER
jgi:putative glutamine amidotransferase